MLLAVPRYWRGSPTRCPLLPTMGFNWKAETQGTRSRRRHGAGAGLRGSCEEAAMNSHLILKHCILIPACGVCACARARRMLASVVRASVTGRNPRSMS